jgi:hypothetical protein
MERIEEEGTTLPDGRFFFSTSKIRRVTAISSPIMSKGKKVTVEPKNNILRILSKPPTAVNVKPQQI